MPENNFQSIVEKLRPDIERLVRKADGPEVVVSGFIFSNNPKSLIRFGNNGNEGNYLIQLHLALSSLAAEIQSQNTRHPVSYVDIGPSESVVEDNSKIIADQLAQVILVSGAEPDHKGEIIELAQRYLMAREREAKS